MHEIVNPVGNKVVICKDEDKSVTRGGIVLPDSTKIPTMTGRVVGISPKIENDYDYSNIKKYCKVIFSPYNAIPVDFEKDNKLFIIPVSDIIAVLDRQNDDGIDEQGALVVA